MKKFFLVLLFCVFPFQVLAGDVSYWADGQIKRKGVSGKVVAIGMAWNGSGCLVKKAPNREEGGFSVRILRDGAALVWTVSRPGGARRGGGPLQSAAQRFGEEGQQFRDLRRGGRVRKQPGNPAGPRGGQAGLGHLHAAGEQAVTRPVTRSPCLRWAPERQPAVRIRRRGTARLPQGDRPSL